MSVHPDVFVVERYYDNGVGDVIGAFMSLADAQSFSDRAVGTCRTYHEIAITQCGPSPRERWRRFADDRQWLGVTWEYRKLAAGAEGRS